MRGDLNEQFQRAQAVTDDDAGPRKLIIGLVIALLVSFALIMIAGTIFFVKTMDKIIETNPDESTSSSYSSDSSDGTTVFDPFAPSGSGSLGNSKDTGKSDIASNFKAGTVTGTEYYSSFSGITFSAPSDWTVTGYSDGSYTNPLSPKDLSASSADMASSVCITYEAMKSHLYTDATDALKSYKETATSGVNNSMINDSVTKTFGGNKFTGIVYKKTMDASFSYFTEVLVAEVNGYALEIYIEANTEADLNAILGMFS